jgi:endonuclease IV
VQLFEITVFAIGKVMPSLGAHMSIAGGYYKAVEAAAELGMETVQLFTKNFR